MADENVIEPTSAERGYLALRASWQIEAAASLIRERLDNEAESSVLKVLARRIEALASAQMSALGDDSESVESIQKVVDME